jgi:hypothetical protein
MKLRPIIDEDDISRKMSDGRMKDFLDDIFRQLKEKKISMPKQQPFKAKNTLDKIAVLSFHVFLSIYLCIKVDLRIIL